LFVYPQKECGSNLKTVMRSVAAVLFLGSLTRQGLSDTRLRLPVRLIDMHMRAAAPFLSPSQRSDIFYYENANRFLQLKAPGSAK
jgi:hypothetical protein